jgi:hypothetical protein
MGIDLVSPILAIPRGLEPDWGRAGAWIDNLDPAALYNGGELFPLEFWEEESREREGLDRSRDDRFAFMSAARQDLRRHASILRAAIEQPEESGVLAVELPEHRVNMAAALDAAGPDELIDSFTFTAECGAARAVGFTHWTRYCEPLEERGVAVDPAGELPPGRPIDAAPGLPDAEPIADWVAWFAVHSFDSAAAEAAVERAAAAGMARSDLEAALDHLRGRLAGEFSRMVVAETVGSLKLWAAADYMGGARTVAALRMLGAAGILEAGGVLAWGVPPEPG